MSKRMTSLIARPLAWSLGLAAVAVAAGLTVTAQSASRGDSFLLGQGRTGAVCDALRDDRDVVLRVQRAPDRSILPWGRKDDEAGAEIQGARAWKVSCRGVTVTVGRIYAFRSSAAVAPAGRWTRDLAGRVDCGPAGGTSLSGFSSATRQDCKAGGADYVVIVARTSGGGAYVAEGYASYLDLLQVGLQVASGQREPPTAVDDAAVAGAAPPTQLGDAALTDDRAWDQVLAMGYDSTQQWRFDQAEANFRTLVLRGETNGATASQKADAALNLALAVSNDARFLEADALFDRAAVLVRAADDRELTALELNYRALHARNQGRIGGAKGDAKFREAIELAQRALSTRPVEGDGVTLTALGGNSLEIGPGAAARLNRAESLSALNPSSRLKPSERWQIQNAQAWQVIATSQRELGDPKAARAALKQAEAALAEANFKAASIWLGARIDINLADLDVEEGRAADAEKRLVAARERLRTVQSGTPAEASLLIELGRARQAAGKSREARADFKAAFEIFSAVRGEVGPSLERTGGYFRQLVSDYRPGDEATASELFYAMQSSVGATTARTMTNLSAQLAQGGGVTAALARSLNETRRLADTERVELARLQGRADSTPAQLEEVNRRVQGYEAQADQIEGRLVALNPGYGQLLSPTVDLKELQGNLRPGEVYLKTLLLADEGFGLAITRDAVKPYLIAGKKAQIADDVARLRAFTLLSSDGSTRILAPFDMALSHALYDRLIAPAQTMVLGATHVIYDPDGSLLSLPPSLLVVDQGSIDKVAKSTRPGRIPSYVGVNWLGRGRALSISVSGASFVQVRSLPASTAPYAFVGFGDPALSPEQPGGARAGRCGEVLASMKLASLPETRAELASVAKSFDLGENASATGAAFTDDTVVARGQAGDLNQYRVVYFATHASLPAANECLSEPGLITSLGGGASDALLDAKEIVKLNLNADLVVLSACDTGGRGSEGLGLRGSSEALGGLTRAFIAAGARSLVVSHWSVSSKATATLMVNMFEAKQPTQAGALAKATSQLMDAPRTSHPYFWAPFTVVGDGARAMPTA